MRLEINPQQIRYDTGKASLIKIPNSDWQFWLSNKCVFNTTIYLNENYTYYTAKKDTKRKSTISGQELIESFSNYTVYRQQRPDVIVREHKPNPKKPLKERRIDNDLIR